MRAERKEGAAGPLHPFTAGVYCATMMAQVSAAGQRALVLRLHSVQMSLPGGILTGQRILKVSERGGGCSVLRRAWPTSGLYARKKSVFILSETLKYPPFRLLAICLRRKTRC